MPSKPPSTPPKPDPEAQQFLGLNAQVFAELLTFLDFAEGFTFGLVEVNFPPNVLTLIEALRQHPHCAEMQFVVVDVSEQPELRFLRDEISAQLARVEQEPDKKLVLVVWGLARAIGTELTGDYPPVLQDLNFVRDAYKLHVPHPLLLVLPDYAVVRLIRFAPDFWAWHSGVFTFKTPETTRQAAHSQAIETYQRPVSRTIPEPQERIDLLERLLMEYQPSTGQTSTQLDLNTCSTILYELGVAYYSHRNFRKATNYLRDTLKIAEQKQDILLQANVHSKLGQIYSSERKFSRAMAEFKKAISFSKSIPNQHQEAKILHYFGNIYKNLRQFKKATELYQECLQIKKNIDDCYEQAETYHQLGYVAQEQREYKQARAYFQQALDIYTEFNDRYEQAGTYHQLGYVAREQQEYEQAQSHFQQALDLFIEFNDRHSQASTYHNLGIVAQEQQEWEQARSHYQQALDLSIEFNDRYRQASTYGQLGLLAESQEDYLQAQQNLLKALIIFAEFNDEHSAGIALRNLARLYQATQDEGILQIVATGLNKTVEEVQALFEQVGEG